MCNHPYATEPLHVFERRKADLRCLGDLPRHGLVVQTLQVANENTEADKTTEVCLFSRMSQQTGLDNLPHVHNISPQASVKIIHSYA